MTELNESPTSSRRPRTFAVVGGAGYIGNVLVRRLLESGCRVRVLDRLDFGGDALRECLPNPDLELIVGDLADHSSLERCLRGTDGVAHLAAVVGDAACARDTAAASEVNVDGAVRVAQAARDLGVPRFVLASTCSVYGSKEEIVDKESGLNPVSHYAETKIEAERLVLELGTESFHPTALRIGTAFGWSPRPRFDLVVNLLSARAYFDRQAVIYNGDRWRPFIHVSDIARAFEAALAAPLETVSGEIFNAGDSEMNHRLADLGKVLGKMFPQASIVEEAQPDPRNYRVNFDKIAETIGFRSETSLQSGIAEIHRNLAFGRIADFRRPIYHNHLVEPATAIADRSAARS